MLEVCVDTVGSAVAAQAAGARRIELCSALDVGGVTPCPALIEAAREQVAGPLMVLIRPRTGGFVYDASEIKQTVESIGMAIDCGADGIVVGALNAQCELDCRAMQSMRTAAKDVQLVCHRAFDWVTDQVGAIDQLVELGFDRILTSGGPTGRVMDHLDNLRQLMMDARGRIDIMPGGGVRSTNALRIQQVTGCSQLHGSFRQLLTEVSSAGLGTHGKVDCMEVAEVARLMQ